jgi:beta-lactamase superfamily II metal-dependent hydrolase
MSRVLALVAITIISVASAYSGSANAQQGGISGDLPADGGFGLIVWGGGTVGELEATAEAEGCDLKTLFVTLDGAFVPFVAGAPEFVNTAFVAAVGLEIPPGTPFAAICSEGPTGAPGSVLSFRIDFIDVGQGDATLITVNGERLLIDGGRSQGLIETRLDALGITDLDAILSTHPDADHIAGLVRVLELYKIERIYLNGGESDSQVFAEYFGLAAAEGADVVTITRGDVFLLGGLVIDVLHPGALSGESNDDSAVVQLICGTVGVLLTGDATVASEEEMLSAGVLGNMDVLKVGHHGSDTSSSQAFLDAVDPEYAVISAGLNSQYGHPHQDVVDRLTAIGAAIYHTDTTSGDDTLTMTSDCLTVAFDSAPWR